jgi:hypothetical protein
MCSIYSALLGLSSSPCSDLGIGYRSEEGGKGTDPRFELNILMASLLTTGTLLLSFWDFFVVKPSCKLRILEICSD